LTVCLTGFRWLAFAASGARARKNPIAFDEANKQIEQKLALRWLQHRQHALPTGESFRAYAVMQPLAIWREIKKADASVGAVDLPGKETIQLKSIDQQARAVAIDAEPFGKAALIDAGLLVDIAQHGEFERR